MADGRDVVDVVAARVEHEQGVSDLGEIKPRDAQALYLHRQRDAAFYEHRNARDGE